MSTPFVAEHKISDTKKLAVGEDPQKLNQEYSTVNPLGTAERNIEDQKYLVMANKRYLLQQQQQPTAVTA